MKVGTDAVLLGAWVNIGEVNAILDVGTGTGILALMMAQRTKARIDAVEIDPSAAAEAQRNISLSPWPERVRIHTTSFQEFAIGQMHGYELIISNPPYFSNSLKPPDTARSKARHDDLLPLDTFMKGVDKLLSLSGKLAVIIPFEARNSWIPEAAKFGLSPSRKASVVPREGKPTSRLMIEFRKGGNPTYPEEMILIRDLSGSYTQDYKQLTCDFYLGI